MMLYSKGSKVFPFVFVNATIIWMYTGTERLGFQGFPARTVSWPDDPV